MKLKLLRLSLSAIFLISLASLGAILLFIDPFKAGAGGLGLFSVLAFLLFFSFFSLGGLWLRRKFVSDQNLARILKMVFRQSALVAVLVLGSLWLVHFRLFKIWTALPLLILVFGMEYLFLIRGWKVDSGE